jgi:hypothetical protein
MNVELSVHNILFLIEKENVSSLIKHRTFIIHPMIKRGIGLLAILL